MDRIRVAKALTWLEFAAFLGISRQYLSFLKSGARTLGPKIERRLREAEKDIEQQNYAFTTTGLPTVHEAHAPYDSQVTLRKLDVLAAENLGLKERLAELDQRIRKLEGRDVG